MIINTIFKKMLTIAILFSLGSLLCSSLLIGFLLEKQIYERTNKTLVYKANALNREVKRFLAGEIPLHPVKKQMIELKEKENIQVSIITENQKPLFSEQNTKIQKWMTEVIKKKSGFAEVSFQKNEKSKMFIIGVPLVIEGKNKGAILLYTPVNEAESLIQDINQIIFISILILLIPIVLISFVLSKKIVAPIVSMSKTVKLISNGNFNERVILKGKDEFVFLGESINQMAQKLSLIEQSRRRFIGEISHELRTPLTTIRTTLQGLTDQIFSKKEEKEFISLSIGEIKRIGKLLDDLIDLSALEEKAVILQKDRENITDLLEEVILQLSMQAKNNDVFIRKDLARNVECDVDSDRLKQVFINILENAIKHSITGTQIDVKLISDDSHFFVEISNTGIPIPNEALSHLFERFYKTDQSRSKKGNGLGLSIAKQIIELHNGKISVQTQNGLITFIVEIPHLRMRKI